MYDAGALSRDASSPYAPGEASWRAARVGASVGAFLDGNLAPDDLLESLQTVGAPDVGWWEVIASLRAVGAARPPVCVRLPRPGDPRGVALPRGVVAEGLVGYRVSLPSPGSMWLVPEAGDRWLTFTLAADLPGPADPAECDRSLRAAIVQAAHALDVAAAMPPPVGGRDQAEATVDAWVLGTPALAAAQRAMASTALRVLLALDSLPRQSDAVALSDTTALERAARDALEAAYSSPASHG